MTWVAILVAALGAAWAVYERGARLRRERDVAREDAESARRSAEREAQVADREERTRIDLERARARLIIEGAAVVGKLAADQARVIDADDDVDALAAEGNRRRSSR